MTDRPVVLLTGASSGLGLAIARRLLGAGYRLALTARSSSLSRFDEAGIAESESVKILPLDVTQPRERESVVAEIQRLWGGVDILINNAGVAYRSVVEHVTEDERLAQLDINFRAPMELTRLVLPGMRAKRAGRILNVSSVGGMMAMPTMAVYSASKFALEGASEALWYEVRPWNIHVTLVQPGFVRSDSFQNTRHTRLSRRGVDDILDPYHAHYCSMAPFIEKLMRLSPASPDSVARTVLKVLRRKHPPLRAPATIDAQFFSLLRRWLPRELYHRFLYWNLPAVRSWGPNGLPGAAAAEALPPRPH